MSVYTRMAPEAEKQLDVLVVEVNIPLATLKDFLPSATEDPAR